MNPLKLLLKETAIYGISSIVGRALFFLLTPFYTRIFEDEEYGKYADLYSIISFLLILLGYGMETAYFRYSLKENPDKKKAYSTALTTVTLTTLIAGALLFIFLEPLSILLQNNSYSHLLGMAIMVVVLDTITSIPFAHLRATNRPIKFAIIKISGILLNIFLNLFFLWYCPKVVAAGGTGGWTQFIESIYNPNIGIGYALIANIADSALKLLLLSPQVTALKGGINFGLLKKMLQYGWPIMVVSFAGMINEVADRQLLKFLLPKEDNYNIQQLGIYGACYKLSIFLSLFTQAFRYAGEPFFFARAKDKDAKATYAKVMKYFVLASIIGFLVVSLLIDLFKHFVGSGYWEGLAIVPILLMAYVFYGIYYNLSIWYKLTDKTGLGAVVAIIGAAVTLVINFAFIPKYGYMASAWATLACFVIMSVISYFWGRKHYPIQYEVKSILLYLALATGLYFGLSFLTQSMDVPLRLIIHSVGIAALTFFMVKHSGLIKLIRS